MGRLALLGTWITLACVPARPLSTSAPARPAEAARPESARPGEPAPKWEHFDAAVAWPVAAEYVSRGHLVGASSARVRVSPLVAEAYANWTRGLVMPPEAVLTQELLDERGAPTQWFVMERPSRGGAWNFSVLAPDGSVTAHSLAACGRCHEQGTSDGVFGPPRAG